MRCIGHLATKTSFGSGIMFIFAAGLEFIAFLLALALPTDKTNSRRSDRSIQTIPLRELEDLVDSEEFH